MTRPVRFRGPRRLRLLPCPVCKVSPIPKGHVHDSADLKAWSDGCHRAREKMSQ